MSLVEEIRRHQGVCFPYRREMDDHERREIIRLAQTDLNYVQIAQRVGRPLGSVVNVVNKAIHAGVLPYRKPPLSLDKSW